MGVSTLTDLVNELKNRRLVKELDPIRRPAAGRPTRPITLDGGPWCVMGVHIDVDTIEIAVTTVGGEELLRESVPVDLRESDADQGYAVIDEAITGVLRQLDADRELISVEVGLAGYISRDRGSLCTSHTFGWEDVPLRSLLEQTLRHAGVENPVHIGMANDCQYAALFAGRVELQLPPEMVAVYFGGLRNLGSGVLIDGEIFGGAQGGAGDVGHTNVPGGEPCWCGRPGCLQTAISPIALLTRSSLLPQAGADQMVAERPMEAVALITEAAETGDERVLATLTSAGETLGTVLDDMLGGFNPHAVILGGYLGDISTYLMPGIESKVASRVANLAFTNTRIVPLTTDQPRVVVGGAVVAAGDAVLSEPMRLTRVVG